ncbi:MAG: hypothetical protein ACM3O7_02930 [Acidobacteriota bacterium]
MTSQLPWPDSFLVGRSWHGVGRLATRIAELAAADALPATLLLVGSPGLGREALAVEAAAALVCRESGRPGCDCGSCDRVRRGMHPDVEVIDVLPGKSEILIDEQIRPFTANLEQRPFEGRRRVTIVASCHTPPLNVHSASALLKALEEPPSHATIFLIASNPARVLPTILSRSVQVRVPPPSEEERLTLVAAHHSLSPERAAVLLAASGDDAAAVLAGDGEELAAALAALHGFAGSALAGSPLALLQFGAAVKRMPAGALAATACLLDLARGASPERAEAILDAAAQVMGAERRHRSFHVDLEAAVVGGLARMVAAAGDPGG